MPVSKPLGQSRPTGTTAATLYALPSSGLDNLGRATIRSLVVCNTTGVAATYRIFLDIDGTTYDADSALVYDKNLGANETVWYTNLNLEIDNTAAGLGVRTGTANALCFTVFGTEENF